MSGYWKRELDGIGVVKWVLTTLLFCTVVTMFFSFQSWTLVLVLLLGTVCFWYIDWRAKPWQCAKCRYDLRGLEGGVCPECGSERQSSS